MSRNLLEHFPVSGLLITQLSASVIALSLMSLPYHPWHYFSPSLGKASLTGILEPGLTYSIGLWGLSMTSAASATIIGSTEPIFILLLAWLVLKNKPSRRLFICISGAVLGLLLISSQAAEGALKRSFIGDVLVVIATFFAASYVISSAKLVDRFPAVILAWAQQVVGLVCAFMIHTIYQLISPAQPAITNYSWSILIYAAASGVVQYALAFWLYLFGLKHLSPSAAGLWLTLTPVFGVAGAYLFLNEVPNLPMLVGMIFIIGSVAISQLEG